MNTNEETANVRKNYDFKCYLGKTKGDRPERIYLRGFEWACGWYWSGGGIESKNMWTHFDGTFLDTPDIRGHSLGRYITPWTIVREQLDPAYKVLRSDNKVTVTHKNGFSVEYIIMRNGSAIWEPIETFLDNVPEHISKNWWRIKDLYKQFYTLCDAAEVFQYGGHCTSGGRNPAEINLGNAKLINDHIENVIIPEIVKLVQVQKKEST